MIVFWRQQVRVGYGFTVWGLGEKWKEMEHGESQHRKEEMWEERKKGGEVGRD